MLELSKIRNIGIAAHIDSGKTTLSERILFYTGKIHAIHEVRGKDGAGAKMDSMELEKEKGITIQSAATYTTWGDYNINIIDTPGHIDFTVEVERSLRVLDGAILVLCGVAGVQSQSITVERQMRRYNVPRIAFINKLDRAGANPFKVADQLREKLFHKPCFITIPIGLEDKFEGVIDVLKMKAIYFKGPEGTEPEEADIPADYLDQAKEYRNHTIETLSDFDDNIAEKFLMEEEITEEELLPVIRRETLNLKITPVFCGSAMKNKGVQPLLNGVTNFLPNPTEVTNHALDLDNNEAEVELKVSNEQPLVALAFKLEDGKYGQLTYMRVYQGVLKKGDTIFNTSNNKKFKVPRLVRMHSDEMHEIDEAGAGDIVALFGIDCASGDTFTDGKLNWAMTSMFIPTPVIELTVMPKEKSGQINFSKALNRFTKEDPTFQVSRDEESGDTIIKGMGELHLEVYVERIKREYKTEVVVGEPKVAYRETITQAADYDYTHKKQSGGSGQFGRVAGTFEPMPAEGDTVYEFENKIVGGSIPKEYIPAVDKGFQEQMQEGVLIGQPIVGIKATLSDGSTHAVDSSDMAFKLAAKAALRENIQKLKPVLLEPVMKLETSAPEEFQGVVIGQLNQRRGIIVNTSSDNGYVVVEAEVPLKEMFGYSTDLRSATQGKGEFSMEFAKYAQMPKMIQEEIIKAYEAEKAAEK
ncbi:MAG: elongation factor G [Candidatus Kapaibacteriales bacterium]